MPAKPADLKQFVQSQSAAALAERLWAWAEGDRDLMADLKAWAVASQPLDDSKSLINIKKVIAELLASDGYIDWRESASYAHRAARVVPLIEAVLAQDAARARALCDFALRELYRASEEADDSDGEIGDVTQQLMDLMVDCLKAAPPPAEWLDDWFALMKADPWGLWSEAQVVEAAGLAFQAVYGQRVARDWKSWLASHPPAQPKANPAPEKSTDRILAYRHFDFERSQLRTRYLNDLKRQGASQTALQVMRSQLDGAAEHSELVKYCESLKRFDEALQHAETAHGLFPQDGRADVDLLRCYERQGYHPQALAIRRKWLEKSPTVENFQATLKAAKSAGKALASYRDELFAWAQAQETNLPQARAWRSGSGRLAPPMARKPGPSQVDTRANWLLHEGRLDEALALVQPPHECAPALLRSIAKKLPKERDADALPLLLRVFAMTMPGASTPYAGEIGLVNEIASRIQQPERGHWLTMIRAEFKIKRNFIKGLDAAKLPG